MALHRAATPSLLGGTPLSIGLSQIYNLTQISQISQILDCYAVISQIYNLTQISQISQILDCYAVISQILPAYVLDGNSGKAAKICKICVSK